MKATERVQAQQGREEASEQREGSIARSAPQEMADSSPPQDGQPQSAHNKVNKAGLPDQLKSGIENLSGYSMDDVKVHYNSGKPAQLQAHAYTQGTDIYLAPGQEEHLPHEAWHAVQQMQGRVQPTMQMKGMIEINDDSGLEKEADVMGAKAISNTATTQTRSASSRSTLTPGSEQIVQRTGLGMRDYTRENSVRDDATLEKIYKDAKDSKNDDSKKYLRSKWKGKRDDSGKTLGIPLRTGDRKTEEKEKKTADRIGWTEGHNKLRDQDIEPKVRHENSHALGHGDYGSDNYLSALPATKFQNTEQLAIEEGMREAAEGGHEVRIKITDVINKDTGRLEVRRFKISTMNKDNKWVSVFDHLMDGQRKGLTRKDTFKLKEEVLDSIKNPPTEDTKSKKKGDRKGIDKIDSKDDEIDALRTHQYKISEQLISLSKKKDAVNMMDVLSLGPGFTELNIRDESGTESYDEKTALNEAINTVAGGKQKENFSKKAKGGTGGVIGTIDNYKKTKARLQVYLYGKLNKNGERVGKKLIEVKKNKKGEEVKEINKDFEHLNIGIITELGVDLHSFDKYSKELEKHDLNPGDYEDKDEPVLPYITGMEGIVNKEKKDLRKRKSKSEEESSGSKKPRT